MVLRMRARRFALAASQKIPISTVMPRACRLQPPAVPDAPADAPACAAPSTPVIIAAVDVASCRPCDSPVRLAADRTWRNNYVAFMQPCVTVM